MKKIEKLEILKNVGSSWIALGMNVSVGVFLSPYILHRLGDEAFGLWVLIFSVTGYYGLFDLGIRSSIVRYVAKYSARADHNQLNRLVNTAFFAYSAIGIICLLLTFIGTRYVDAWFHVPPNFLATARLLFLMVGISVALGFPLGVFGGILEGLQRFYFLNFSSVLATLTRALFIVIALKHGAQLLTVALITVAMPLGTGLLNAIIALRLTPVRFACSNLDRGSLRTIASYSGTTFMIIIAGRLRFKTDAMVIGTMLSAAAITYFAIASRLLDYAAEVVSSLAQIFVPMSSHSDATGDTERLKKILLAGNRACALIIFPISATLLILGKSIIATWVGMKYVPLSYPVLLVLILPQTLMLAQAASARSLGYGQAPGSGLRSFGRGRSESDSEHYLGSALRNRWRCLGDCDPARRHHHIVLPAASMSCSEDSFGGLSASGIFITHTALAPFGCSVALDEALVLRPYLSRAGDSAGDCLDGIRRGTWVGHLEPKCLGSWRAR